MRMTGFEAIAFAQHEGLGLNKSADSVEGAASGLSVAEATAIAADYPDLIWIEVSDEQFYGVPEPMGLTP
ncbi:MAG: hypothetical protein ABFC96_06765 [Thermoguttaceae bacterium]